MNEAAVSLQSAIDELRTAQDALDGELAAEVRKLIADAQVVLDEVRARLHE